MILLRTIGRYEFYRDNDVYKVYKNNYLYETFVSESTYKNWVTLAMMDLYEDTKDRNYTVD